MLFYTETDMEKLAYTLKYAHQIDPTNEAENPPFWQEPWLDEILKKIDLNRMSPEQRVMFDMSLVKEVMYHQKLEDVAKEAKEIAKIEKATEVAILAHKEGLDVATISKIAQLPEDKVREIIEKFERDNSKMA